MPLCDFVLVSHPEEQAKCQETFDRVDKLYSGLLSKFGVTVEYRESNGKHVFGQYYHTDKLIVVRGNHKDLVETTIHECVHAIKHALGQSRGHGRDFWFTCGTICACLAISEQKFFSITYEDHIDTGKRARTFTNK